MLDHNSQKATAGQVFNTNIGEFQSGESRPVFRDIGRWHALASDLSADSPAVARFSAEELQARWLDGMACIATDTTNIVAYTSLIPVESEHTVYLGRRVFEASSGWTLPGFRRKQLQCIMRQRFYLSFGNDLLISFCMGMGASMVLQKIGWSLVDWDPNEGIAPLIGEVRDGALYHRLGDSVNLSGRMPYQRKEHSGSMAHPWDSYLHLWVSDRSLAKLV